MAAVSVDRRDASALLAFSSLSYQPTSCAWHTTHAIPPMLCEQLCNCQISGFQEVLLRWGLIVLLLHDGQLLHDGHLRGSPCGARSTLMSAFLFLYRSRPQSKQEQAAKQAARQT